MIISMDVALLAMEYSSQYEIEATLKAMVYSIKLKLEFAVLNQLMNLANSSVNKSRTRQPLNGLCSTQFGKIGHSSPEIVETSSRRHRQNSRQKLTREVTHGVTR